MQYSYKTIIIWILGVSFVLLQFFLQLSSGIVIDKLMHQIEITAFTAGLLSSAFYFVYTTLQVPVGFLFDSKNTRLLLSGSTFIMSIGCFIFSHSIQLPYLFIGRFLMGLGSAFAFVGLSHLLREHFPVRKFAFWLGFSETFAFLVTVLAMLNMNYLLNQLGWRGFIYLSGIIGFTISILCWLQIPKNKPKPKTVPPKEQLLKIVSNKIAWINGLYACLGFSVVTVFASLWAIPFLQLKLHCTLPQASFQSGVFFLGAAISCPIFGMLDIHLPKRRVLMIVSAAATSIILACILYLPIYKLSLMGVLMLLLGLFCGAYMLSYTIANEISPDGSMSTCAGFTNTLAMLSAPVLQPLVGSILDFVSKGEYTLQNYQTALTLLPVALFSAALLVFKLPEKNQNEVMDKDLVKLEIA